MLIRFLKFSSIIALGVLIMQCQGSLDPTKKEALQLYNQLSDQAEKAIDDFRHVDQLLLRADSEDEVSR